MHEDTTRRVVVRIVRILAPLQRKTLIETKNRTLKCLKWNYSTVQSMKNVTVLTEDGAFAPFCVSTPGDLTAQKSPPPGIFHPMQKNANARGSTRKGGGGGGGRGAGGID